MRAGLDCGDAPPIRGSDRIGEGARHAGAALPYALRTVGSLYHRNVAAYMRLRAAWLSAPSDTEPDAVRATGAAYILVCPGAVELYGDDAGNSLMRRLSLGVIPPWLEPVVGDPESGYILYRIRH